MLFFVIAAECLDKSNDVIRQSFARLAHYFSFHYECRWYIYNKNQVDLKGWHPLVSSPIPYPQIDIIYSLQDINQFSIIIFLTTDNRTQYINERSPIHTFMINSLTENISSIQTSIEKTFMDLLTPFRKKLPPSRRFYDLFFPSDWEDIFYNRTTLPPIENTECERFGPFTWLRRLEYSWALTQLDYTRWKKTLDVGSLNTFVPRYLAEKGLTVTSIDIEPSAVEFQKSVAASLIQPFFFRTARYPKHNIP